MVAPVSRPAPQTIEGRGEKTSQAVLQKPLMEIGYALQQIVKRGARHSYCFAPIIRSILGGSQTTRFVTRDGRASQTAGYQHFQTPPPVAADEEAARVKIRKLLQKSKMR